MASKNRQVIRREAIKRNMDVSINSPGDGHTYYQFESMDGGRNYGPRLKGIGQAHIFLAGHDAAIDKLAHIFRKGSHGNG